MARGDIVGYMWRCKETGLTGTLYDDKQKQVMNASEEYEVFPIHEGNVVPMGYFNFLE